MRKLSWSDGEWSREPASIRVEGEHLFVEAIEASDWWRTTSYGFIHNDGHALLRDFPDQSSTEVSFILNYSEQFDQCGIFIYADDEHWIKAGVEYSDGAPQLGAVVTSIKSDWSVAPVAQWFGREVTMRASRDGDALTIRAKSDGEFQLVRVIPIDQSRRWRSGPMICAPTRAGLVGEFTGWSIGESDASLH